MKGVRLILWCLVMKELVYLAKNCGIFFSIWYKPTNSEGLESHSVL
jgi:uncharacterized membrane protein YoaT (DUF817 family)